MTDADTAEIINIKTRRGGDGSLREVTVRANYYSRDPDTAEKIKAVFEVSDGVAEVTTLYDVDTAALSGADYADGITPQLFRTAAAVETAVGRVPGVETAISIEQTVAEELRTGEGVDVE